MRKNNARVPSAAKPWAVSLFDMITKAQPSASDVHVPSPPQKKKKDADPPLADEKIETPPAEVSPPVNNQDDDFEVVKALLEETPSLGDPDAEEARLALEAMMLDEEGSDALPVPADKGYSGLEENRESKALGSAGGPQPSAPGAPSAPVRSAPDATSAEIGAVAPDDISSGAMQILGPILDEKEELGADNVVAKSYGETAKVPILKINSKKQIVYGVVLAPAEQDLQDDMMWPEDIEKTAHAYLKNSRKIKSSHEGEALDADVVESYIAPIDFHWSDDRYGSQSIQKGSWVMGVKINDPSEWAKVERGDYNGFSVGGQGLRDKLV